MKSVSAQFHRALWHANRTPLARVLKGTLSMAHAGEKSRRRAVGRAVPVTGLVRERADTLARQGYVMLTDIVDTALAAELSTASLTRLAEVREREDAQTGRHKNFWVRLLDRDKVDGALDCDNVFVRFAMQPAIVSLLCARLGEMPRLMDALLTYSQPGDAALSYSQLWHRDHDDTRTTKVFVYLTDVSTREDGPFTFLPGEPSDRVGFTLKSHLPDDKFFGFAPRDAVVEMRAPRLTAFACETSRCWHMGSRVLPGHARLMYTATYVTEPNLYGDRAVRFRASRPLSDQERLLLMR